MERFANVKAIRALNELNEDGFLLKIDIKKAFDSLPWTIIHQTLRKLNVPHNIITYIMNFVQLRHSYYNG